jgi:hypothetical protein
MPNQTWISGKWVLALVAGLFGAGHAVAQVPGYYGAPMAPPMPGGYPAMAPPGMMPPGAVSQAMVPQNIPVAYRNSYMPAGPVPVEDGMVISGGEYVPASECGTCSDCDAESGGLLGAWRRRHAGGCGLGGCGSGACGLRGCGNGCGTGGFGSGCGLFGGCGMLGGCGLAGCNECGGCGLLNCGSLGSCLKCLGPYTAAGLCAVRHYDFSAEVLWMGRNRGFSSQDVTSLGRLDQGGSIVMSTDDLSVGDLEAGMRLAYSHIVGPASEVEVIYFGLNEWDDTVSVSSSDPNLFSAWSDFGVNPPGGYDDTDRSLRQSLNYQSEIHSGEVNYRARSVHPCCRFQGSWLAGMRLFNLDETLHYTTEGEFDDGTGQFLRYSDTRVRTRNMLVGPQAGFDLWWNIFPGIHAGMEYKFALCGNSNSQDTRFEGNSVPTVFEDVGGGRTAYLNEFSITGLYRISYNWTLKASYIALAVDNVALAPSNLNFSGPSGFGGPPVGNRDVFLSNSDRVTFSGISLGTEYIW